MTHHDWVFIDLLFIRVVIIRVKVIHTLLQCEIKALTTSKLSLIKLLVSALKFISCYLMFFCNQIFIFPVVPLCEQMPFIFKMKISKLIFVSLYTYVYGHDFSRAYLRKQCSHWSSHLINFFLKVIKILSLLRNFQGFTSDNFSKVDPGPHCCLCCTLTCSAPFVCFLESHLQECSLVYFS